MDGRRLDPSDTEREVPPETLKQGYLPGILDFCLARARNHLRRNRSEAGYTLPPGWFACLALMVENPGLAQIEISREMEVDKATVVANVDALEKGGLLIRKRSAKDRRRHALFITDQGREALEEARRAFADTEKPVRDKFTEAEWNILLSLLARIYR